jgi:nucleoside-diphosphate-sugar epimerase
MSKAVMILGGTGQIGAAAIDEFAMQGWRIISVQRGKRSGGPPHNRAKQVNFDRADTEMLREALGGGVDVLVDTIGYTEDDARQLLSVADRIGSIIAISSSSVYVDSIGRTLDEATRAEEFPHFPGPISESNPTVAPGDLTYSTRKVAMEQTLLHESPVPATVLRPGAIYGCYSQHAREWFFVKRVLDGRRVFLYSVEGRTKFHPASTQNLARLILAAAERPGTRVLNCGDPTVPTVLEIGKSIAAAMGAKVTHVLCPGAAPVGSPWGSTLSAWELDMSRARTELGYEAVASYESAVAGVCGWLSCIPASSWEQCLPGLAAYPRNLFDYDLEDEVIRDLVKRDRGTAAL